MSVLSLVRLEVEERFSSEDVPRVLAQLAGLDLPPYPTGATSWRGRDFACRPSRRGRGAS